MLSKMSRPANEPHNQDVVQNIIRGLIFGTDQAKKQDDQLRSARMLVDLGLFLDEKSEEESRQNFGDDKTLKALIDEFLKSDDLAKLIREKEAVKVLAVQRDVTPEQIEKALSKPLKEDLPIQSAYEMLTVDQKKKVNEKTKEVLVDVALRMTLYQFTFTNADLAFIKGCVQDALGTDLSKKLEDELKRLKQEKYEKYIKAAVAARDFSQEAKLKELGLKVTAEGDVNQLILTPALLVLLTSPVKIADITAKAFIDSKAAQEVFKGCEELGEAVIDDVLAAIKGIDPELESKDKSEEKDGESEDEKHTSTKRKSTHEETQLAVQQQEKEAVAQKEQAEATVRIETSEAIGIKKLENGKIALLCQKVQSFKYRDDVGNVIELQTEQRHLITEKLGRLQLVERNLVTEYCELPKEKRQEFLNKLKKCKNGLCSSVLKRLEEQKMHQFAQQGKQNHSYRMLN